MDYSILWTDDLIITFVGVSGLVFTGYTINARVNWKYILVLILAFLGLTYYAAEVCYSRTLNQHDDALAYLYKQAIEVYPESNYAQKYYEMSPEEQGEINNLISNMDSNRGKIGYYYGYATLGSTRDAARLWGTSMFKMYGTPAIIPVILVLGLTVAGTIISKGVQDIRDYNRRLKEENKNLKDQNEKAKIAANQSQDALDDVNNRLKQRQKDLRNIELSKEWQDAEKYQKKLKDYKDQINDAITIGLDYENRNNQLKETNKQLQKEYQNLVAKKEKIEKEIAAKEKDEKEAEKDAYNMLDAL